MSQKKLAIPLLRVSPFKMPQQFYVVVPKVAISEPSLSQLLGLSLNSLLDLKRGLFLQMIPQLHLRLVLWYRMPYKQSVRRRLKIFSI